MAKRPVGEASVKISVDGLDEAKKGLDDIKSKTEQVGESGRSGMGKLDSAVGKVGKRIEDSTEGLRRFQGAISGIIGVVGGLAAIGVGAFKKITGEIRQAREAAEAFDASLRGIRTTGQDAVRAIEGFGDTKDQLGQLEEQIRNQRQAIGQATAQAIADAQKKYEEANPFNPLAEKRARKQLEEDLAEIQANERRDLQRLNEAAAKKRAEVEAEVAEESAAEIGRIQDEKEREIAERTRALRLATLDDVGRAEEELAFRQKQIQNEIAEAGGDDRRVAQLREILALETQIGNAKIKAAKDANAEQNKQEADANKELARQLQEVARAATEQAKAINENTREIRGLRERVINFTPDIRRVSENTARRTR